MIERACPLSLGDAPDPPGARVAQGIRKRRPNHATLQLRLRGRRPDMRLPDLTRAAARAARVKTVVIGAANRGSVIAPARTAVLASTLGAACDRAPGPPTLLRNEGDLAAAARAARRKRHDVQVPPVADPIANAASRQRQRRLAADTDCPVGNVVRALCCARAMRAGAAVHTRKAAQGGDGARDARGGRRRPSAPPARPAAAARGHAA